MTASAWLPYYVGMDGIDQGGKGAETEAEREARYFAGYQAIPDGDDEDFKAVDRLARKTLREAEE